MSQFRFEKFVQHRLDVGVPAALVQWVDDQGEEKLVWMGPADIRNNVLMHGPHYGLLVAASHYHMKADQLVALHRSKGKNKAFLQPKEPARDHLGFWTHPDYPATEYGDASLDFWVDLLGHEHSVILLYEDAEAAEISERYFYVGGGVADWQPARPDGDGWFVASIYDTEDGPACIWLRKLEVA